MYRPAYLKITQLASQPEALERAIAYLQEHIGKFLLRRERVLICFTREESTICHVFEEAVIRCGGIPLMLGEDRRWMIILRTAFTSKCNAIIGPPLLVLGLGKLARHMGIPLYTRNVVLAGYPCTEWMVEGIQRELDCTVWGCFDPGVGSVVAGFSCGKSFGIHLRTEEYGLDVLDPYGKPVLDNSIGKMILYPLEHPEVRFDTGDLGRLDTSRCPCGSCVPRVTAISPVETPDSKLSKLGEEFHLWTSILDCRLAECGYGLELEMIVFPGEKLPKLPSFSKMVIRPWDPERDEPFNHTFVMKNRFYSEENH